MPRWAFGEDAFRTERAEGEMENGRPSAYVTGVWRSVSPPNAQTSYNSGFVLPYSIECRVAASKGGRLPYSTDFDEPALHAFSVSANLDVVG